MALCHKSQWHTLSYTPFGLWTRPSVESIHSFHSLHLPFTLYIHVAMTGGENKQTNRKPASDETGVYKSGKPASKKNNELKLQLTQKSTNITTPI